jgi:hypothetical protein
VSGSVARTALLAAAFAAATAGLGWWSVAVVAALWGVLARTRRRPAAAAAVAAALAWGALLLWTTSRGAAGALAGKLGTTMGIPPAALFGVTLLFAALLAWSAAAASHDIARLLTRPRAR